MDFKKLIAFFALGLALHSHPIAATSAVLEGAGFGQPKKIRYLIYGDNHIMSSGQNVLPLALELVTKTLKDRFELIEVQGKEFDLLIDITDRPSIINRNWPTTRFDELNLQGRNEAYSYPAVTSPNKPIVIRVLWEEAVFQPIGDGNYNPRPDAFARLTTVIGREVLGNYPFFRRNLNLFESPAFLNSVIAQNEEVFRAETRALEAGVEFLTKLLKESEAQLNPKFVSDFNLALEAEETLLKNRQNYPGTSSPHKSATIIDFAKARCERQLK